MKNYIITGALIIAVGTACFITGKHFGKTHNRKKTALPEKEKTEEYRLEGYKFISPLLECDNYQASKEGTTVEMERKVERVIESARAAGTISHVSFYYRDLNNGPWIGLGEKENFSPASLLKVPIMIAAFKKAESDPTFLKKKARYEIPFNSGLVPNVKDSTIKPGNTYTIEKLISNMIVYSDNEARLLLLQSIEADFINKVYTDIGIDISNFDDGKDFMSVKTYSSFFRLLYNATYLNKEYSEKALQILTRTNFRDGLLGKLPGNVIVAHKFGERGYINANIKQLHDCGIVYKDKAPYLICVMTRGTDLKAQTNLISDISLLVYKHH